MIAWRGVRSFAAPLAGLALGIAVVGCGSSATSTSPAARTPAVASPTQSAAEPTAKPTPQLSPTPATTPSVGPGDSVDPGASPTGYSGPAAACTGSDDNKSFWASAAANMKWDVYCAVLPAGWILTAGSWDGRKGGTIDATYAGPGGARLVIQEGAFCTSGLSACSPHDQVIGPAAFGDRTGSLDTLGPNQGYAIYVSAGQAPSWALTGTGMSQATFTVLASALAKVPRS